MISEAALTPPACSIRVDWYISGPAVCNRALFPARYTDGVSFPSRDWTSSAVVSEIQYSSVCPFSTTFAAVEIMSIVSISFASSSGLTAITVRPSSSIAGMESFNFTGTITRSGFNAAQPSRSNSFAVPTDGRLVSSGALNL